jgi:hypothetical protein
MTMPSLDSRTRERAGPTAVPYVELGARIHGLDGAPSRHSALLKSRNSEDYRLTHAERAEIPRHAAPDRTIGTVRRSSGGAPASIVRRRGGGAPDRH